MAHHPVAPVCQVTTAATVPATTTPVPETTTAVSCPDSWSEYNGECFQWFDQTYYTWVDADHKCLLEGGRLASIHSREQNEFFNQMAQGNTYWIGGYPNGSSITWVWSDLTEFDYSDYNSVISAGDCLYQLSSNYDNGWNSNYCDSSSYRYSYICKLMV